ncbi:MAG: squalene/phytoene synthase family protein [Rhodospirillaceae bacterium]|nr:squalene/phytoene synthase family protein [Rhodospirillaceae bacterium]MCY4310845.1 squalene/phytoene synthase family protein [Rhodospirillaceae bacterium]
MTAKGNRNTIENQVKACRQLARRFDYERYLATLFASRQYREALWILLAFNAEIARTREIVSEPMIGRIRLQWWREVVDAAVANGPVRAHEVAAPLTAAIRCDRLDPLLLSELIDGRERDLDDTPIPDVASLLDYADKTGGVLMAAMAMATGATGAQSEMRSLGQGWALTGLLRAAGFQAQQGRQMLPVSLLRDVGADTRDLLQQRSTDGVRAAAASVATMARDALTAAVVTGQPSDRLMILKPVAAMYLDRLTASGFDLFTSRVPPGPARILWIMLAARWFGRGI